MLNDKFERRFNELNESFKKLPYESGKHDSSRWVPHGKWEHWGTSAQNLILAVFGENSPHYKNFLQAYSKCTGFDHHVDTLHAIFLAAKEDFDGGYVFNVELSISGEVFGDFVSLAKESLASGHKDVAAVLACASLEDALKRYALVSGLQVDQKSMQEIVNALKGKGLVQGAQKTLLDAMPRVRNIALHADWDKLSEADVNSVIGFVEQFLLVNFSES